MRKAGKITLIIGIIMLPMGIIIGLMSGTQFAPFLIVASIFVNTVGISLLRHPSKQTDYNEETEEIE